MQRLELLPVLASICMGVFVLQFVWAYTAFRRSSRADVTPLQPGVRFDHVGRGNRPHLTALIVTTNSEDRIAEAIRGLLAQTIRPDLVVVSADKCTDRTVEVVQSIARLNPQVAVIETRSNTQGVAGALNQGWSEIASFAEIVLQVEDDAMLADDAIEQALGEFHRDSRLGAVTANCRARKSGRDHLTGWSRLLWRIQMVDIELATGLRHEGRDRPQLLVPAFTAFQNWALRDVDEHHDYWGPWSANSMYPNIALTLDFVECRHPFVVGENVRVHTKCHSSLRESGRRNIRYHLAAAEAVRGYRGSSLARSLRLNQLMAGLGTMRCISFVALSMFALIGVSGEGSAKSRTATYAAVLALLGFGALYRLNDRLNDRLSATTPRALAHRVFAGLLVPTMGFGFLRSPGVIASCIVSFRGVQPLRPTRDR
jgi:glycosyltransferase involved in cell wall biosynthesis